MHDEQKISIEPQLQPKMTDMLAQTVKTGIIKSNLIPMWAGLALALYHTQANIMDYIVQIILATIGSAAVIGSAGAFNNIYDRDIDAIMPRTQSRPTVTGQMPVKTTAILAVTLLIVGIIALYFASPLAAFLGFLGVFLYVGPYTIWTKRYTIYNTEIGSLSGAMPPLIGWAVVSSNLTHPAILGLFGVMVIWQMPHFYAIAIRKHADYKAANIPMLPVAKGMKRTYYQTNFYLIILILSDAGGGGFKHSW